MHLQGYSCPIAAENCKSGYNAGRKREEKGGRLELQFVFLCGTL